MLSKGGKITYVCSRCNSPEIVRCGTVIRSIEKGMIEILGMYSARDDSYYCRGCGHFDWWLQRRKCSHKKPLPYVRESLQLTEDNPRHAHRAFYSHESYIYARIDVGGPVDFTMIR